MPDPKRPAGKLPAVGALLQLQIEKLVIGGNGIARHEGLVYFVPDTAPGDLVEVRVQVVKKNLAEARLVRILKPGPGRRTAPCPYVPECGGCNWQHLTTEEQLHEKQRLLEETFRKFLPAHPVSFEAFVPSSLALGYRNRIQPRWKDGQLGFLRRASHEFLPVKDCLIVEEPLRRYFQQPGSLIGLPPKDIKIELRLNETGEATWTPVGDDGEGFGFSQVNRFQNQDLVQTVLRWNQDWQPSEVWDLYSGAGNFTFPLARNFPNLEFTAVEMSSRLSDKAKQWAAQEQLVGLRFIPSDVESFLRRTSVPANAFVLLDPPRAGAGVEVMTRLLNSPAQRITYIACHPVSLVRDLSFALSQTKRSWQITKVQGFEMFPQTDHMEVIAQLESSD